VDSRKIVTHVIIKCRIINIDVVVISLNKCVIMRNADCFDIPGGICCGDGFEERTITVVNINISTLGICGLIKGYFQVDGYINCVFFIGWKG